MSESRGDFEALARMALAIAREASVLVSAGVRRKPAVSEKHPKDLVTEFDLASERLIRERLGQSTPEIPVVGEEQGGQRGPGLTWFCDPLDGTMNFVHGHPFWCVSIGLLEGQRAVAGAVVAPCLGCEWFGAEGFGAFRNQEACAVSQTQRVSDALLATGFPVDRSHSPHNNFDSFARVKREASGVRRCGSAALDACFVADGTYDGYWERSVNAWDLAAGVAIALAAGAELTALDGGPAQLERGHILVSNGRIHRELLTLIG